MEETSWQNLCSGVQSWVTTKAVGHVLGEVSASECEHCASAVGANGDPAAQPISPELALALGEKVKNELPALPHRSYFTPAPFRHIAPIFPHCTSPERFNGGGGHRWKESSAGHNSLDREMQLPACARGTDRRTE